MPGENIPVTSVKLFDAARTLGTRIVAEAGTGKSALMGWLAFADFLKGLPVVVWDQNGGLIDNFFKLVETSSHREKLRPRIRYVELGNSEFAYGLPFYYDAGKDDPFTMSQRLIDIMVKLDPDLKSAPILGAASVIPLATAVGMILSATVDEEGNRWQITEAQDLLLHFKDPRWLKIRERVKEAVPIAEKYFNESYNQWKVKERQDKRYAFEIRVWTYLYSPPLRAMVGQGKPTLRWKQVDEENLAVIFDFRRLKAQKPLEQLSLLTFNSFLEYVRDRGIAATKPISMFIDELPALLEYQSIEPDVRSLATRFRAYKLWPTIGHQAINQLSLALRESAWSFRNQIVGQQSNAHDAEEVVRNLLAPSKPEELMKTTNTIQQFAARQFLFKRFYDESTPDLKVRWIKRTPDIPALLPGAVRSEQVAAAKLRNQMAYAPRVADVLKIIDARFGSMKVPPQERPKA